MGTTAQGGQTQRATLWGCFWGVSPGVIHPQMAPLVLGLLGFAGSIPGRSLPILTDLYRLSWAIYSSHSRVLLHDY